MLPATPGAAAPSAGQRPAAAAAEKSLIRQAEIVPVRVDQLIEGRQLQYPIRDRQGLLLLAAGATIKERFKELLRGRGVQVVLLHEADAKTAVDTPAAEPATAPPAVTRVALNSDLAGRLDRLVDSGNLFAGNKGPQFKDRLVDRGCAAYNSEQRALLVNQHQATCSLLDGMIKSAMHGGMLDGKEIASVVGSYLVQFCFDADCVLDVANQTRSFAALAEQSLHTSLLAIALGIEMGMSEEDIRTIGLAGLLHDWGMTKISEQIRNANRVLNRNEFAEIQKHPLYTLELLQRVSGLPPEVAMICYQAHEQPNGRGYPRGRQHDEIHPGARILHVADAYCALTSPRPFRLPLTPYAAVECLVRNAKDRSFDPDVVRALLHVVSLFPIGSYVVLDDASMARVVRRNGNNFAQPIVQIVKLSDGTRVDPAQPPIIVDSATDGRKIVKAMASPGRQEVALRPELQTLRRI
jgi:HD-GYP domain-containing protein (c-di-GMP phosphodiesterase class II)